MAPCRSRRNPESRRVSGEARVPVGGSREAVSQHQNGEAPALDRGELRRNSGPVQMTNPNNRHVTVQGRGEGIRHAA
jgi:hypothetical protein